MKFSWYSSLHSLSLADKATVYGIASFLLIDHIYDIPLLINAAMGFAIGGFLFNSVFAFMPMFKDFDYDE